METIIFFPQPINTCIIFTLISRQKIHKQQNNRSFKSMPGQTVGKSHDQSCPVKTRKSVSSKRCQLTSVKSIPRDGCVSIKTEESAINSPQFHLTQSFSSIFYPLQNLHCMQYIFLANMVLHHLKPTMSILHKCRSLFSKDTEQLLHVCCGVNDTEAKLQDQGKQIVTVLFSVLMQFNIYLFKGFIPQSVETWCFRRTLKGKEINQRSQEHKIQVVHRDLFVTG